MDIHKTIEFVTEASTKSDRWMFVALLAIGMFAGYGIVRFLTARIDKLQADLEKQNNEFIQFLKTANSEMLQVISSAKIIFEKVDRKLG